MKPHASPPYRLFANQHVNFRRIGEIAKKFVLGPTVPPVNVHVARKSQSFDHVFKRAQDLERVIADGYHVNVFVRSRSFVTRAIWRRRVGAGPKAARGCTVLEGILIGKQSQLKLIASVRFACLISVNACSRRAVQHSCSPHKPRHLSKHNVAAVLRDL
jgi:hypothetical protein